MTRDLSIQVLNHRLRVEMAEVQLQVLALRDKRARSRAQLAETWLHIARLQDVLSSARQNIRQASSQLQHASPGER